MTHNSAKSSNDDSSGARTPGSPDNEKSDGNNDINVESIKEEKVPNLIPNSSPMDHMNKEGKLSLL